MFEQKYYYGDHNIVNSNKVTRNVGVIKDVEYIEVELDDGTKHLVLARNASAVILKQKTDATTLRENKCKRVLEEIAQALHEYNLLWSEWPFIVTNLNKVFEDNEKMATEQVWGKTGEKITFLDIFDKMDAKRSIDRDREVKQPALPSENNDDTK